ncbi:MAG TPA: type II toxin-antitoxin system VapC family toxin [Terracidiphilus sp.]|jgi:predicted nucleic acid-binding protein|nr:type II toxin-antitoxin system VapC family toxin [Terracidiphilus sp.]
MTFLLDNNVVSELRKNRPHGAVVAWRRSVPLHQLAVPGVVIAEIQDGIEITRKQDPTKARDLESWLDGVMSYYTILPADGNIFREWARLMHGKSDNLSADAMIAATARVLRLVVVTRNVKDFKPFNVEVFNPFAYSPEERN